MIDLPQRSVTRFFVPLIDVMILLFAIFLLMPFVSAPDKSLPRPQPEAGVLANMSQEDLRVLVQKLQLEIEQQRLEIAELEEYKNNPAARLSVRVLEIDPEDGKLYYFDPDSAEPRQEVRNNADALRLINQQQRIARDKDPFFLILYPRKVSGYPLQEQIDTYERWFQGVQYEFDNPWKIQQS